MISSINLKVVERPMTTINDTMPYTWIVWGIYAQSVRSLITTQEMSAVRCPVVKKTSTFSD